MKIQLLPQVWLLVDLSHQLPFIPVLFSVLSTLILLLSFFLLFSPCHIFTFLVLSLKP